MTLSSLTSAERLLKSLGVTEPSEIDLEAIALTMGAKVKYRRLEGCAARIVGTMKKAVITVEERDDEKRRRFSLGHEIGHWRHHRGRTFECEASNIGSAREYDSLDPERVADRFAADLLMPTYLFAPLASKEGKMTIDVVDRLAAVFNVSRMAAAIGLVEKGPAPAMVICHSKEKRKWFHPGRDVPKTLFPRETLDPDSFASDVLNGKLERSSPSLIGADAWFNTPGADRYEVVEQSVKGYGSTVLTMIWWKNEEHLESLAWQRGRDSGPAFFSSHLA